MLVAFTAFGLTLAELAIAIGVVAYVVERVVDATGISKSSRTLRRQNDDLVKRNELLETEVTRLRQRIADLEHQVTDLGKRTDLDTAMKLMQSEHRAILSSIEAMSASIVTGFEGLKSALSANTSAVQTLAAGINAGTVGPSSPTSRRAS